MTAPLDNPTFKPVHSTAMSKAPLEKEIQELEALLETLQEAKSIDDSLKSYRKAVQKANGVLSRLAEAKLEIDTHRVSMSS